MKLRIALGVMLIFVLAADLTSAWRRVRKFRRIRFRRVARSAWKAGKKLLKKVGPIALKGAKKYMLQKGVKKTSMLLNNPHGKKIKITVTVQMGDTDETTKTKTYHSPMMDSVSTKFGPHLMPNDFVKDDEDAIYTPSSDEDFLENLLYELEDYPTNHQSELDHNQAEEDAIDWEDVDLL